MSTNPERSPIQMLPKDDLIRMAEDQIAFYLTPNKDKVRPVDKAVDEIVGYHSSQFRPMLPYPEIGGNSITNLYEKEATASSALAKMPDNDGMKKIVQEMTIVTEFEHPILGKPAGLIFDKTMIKNLQKLQSLTPDEKLEVLQKIEALQETVTEEARQRMVSVALGIRDSITTYLTDMKDISDAKDAERKLKEDQRKKEAAQREKNRIERQRQGLENGIRFFGNIFTAKKEFVVKASIPGVKKPENEAKPETLDQMIVHLRELQKSH